MTAVVESIYLQWAYFAVSRLLQQIERLMGMRDWNLPLLEDYFQSNHWEASKSATRVSVESR